MKKYFAPGRINLIGEHLDYNGGWVLPAAIHLGITLTYTPRNDNQITLQSSGHTLRKEIYINDHIEFSADNGWTNYPLGVIEQLKNEGRSVQGCDLYFESNLPEGSGLSSSAAIEIVTAFGLLSQTESNIDLVWLANFCREVENNFIGVQCGVMDQYAVALGRKQHALLIDCHQIKHRYIPFETSDYRLMVMDTKKPRSLIHSKYNERKQECEEAYRLLKMSNSTTETLADIDMAWIDTLQNEVLKKRARHVVTEQLRVKEAEKILALNDLSTFGRLMNASHASLKNDYEVTSIELDTLAETAQQVKGCLGARMTGAGFGGCAIALVHASTVTNFIKTVSEKFLEVTGTNCQIYETEISNGVNQIA